MHKRTVSNQVHSQSYQTQNHHFNHLKASAFIASNTHTKVSYEQSGRELRYRNNMAPKDRCKTQFEDSWASTNQQNSFNIQRFKQLEDMKASNIDDLNNKIKSLINKLTVQQSMKSSSLFTQSSKVRIKTDYSSDFGGRQLFNLNMKNQPLKLGAVESKKMFESKIFSQKNQYSALADKERHKNRNKDDQLAMIRLKYKPSKNEFTLKKIVNFSNEDKVQKKPVLLHEKCKANPNSFKKGKQSLNQKQNLVNLSILGKKKNISEQFSNYEKKLEKYNRKRTELLNQCKNSFILQDLSPNADSNSNFIYSSNFFRKNQANYSPKQFKAYEEGQNELPTADFRKPQEADSLHTFLSNLLSQVKLDEQFRNAKKWLSRCPENRKWLSIEQQIVQRSIDLDQLSVKQIFSLREEEQSPFYSFRQADFTIKTVVDAFLKCQQHWFLNIVKKFDKRSLEQNGLNEKAIDISGKGYISIQDFVRLINMQMGTQTRTRDLFLIFQRLKSEEKLSFGDLIQVVCH